MIPRGRNVSDKKKIKSEKLYRRGLRETTERAEKTEQPALLQLDLSRPAVAGLLRMTPEPRGTNGRGATYKSADGASSE